MLRVKALSCLTIGSILKIDSVWIQGINSRKNILIQDWYTVLKMQSILWAQESLLKTEEILHSPLCSILSSMLLFKYTILIRTPSLLIAIFPKEIIWVIYSWLIFRIKNKVCKSFGNMDMVCTESYRVSSWPKKNLSL